MRKDSSSPDRPAGAVHETVDEPQHFRAITRQGDSWGARRAVEGKMDIVIGTVVDAVTKEFRHFFSVSSGTVQNDADLVIVFLVVQQKVIYGGVMFGQNTGTHRRVTDKALHLFRGEMPEPVDLFSLKDPGGNIFANRAVRQPGEQNKMAYQIVFAASFYRLAPFNACSCRCSHYKTGGAGNQFEIPPVFHSRGASSRERFSPGTFLHLLQGKRFRPRINFFQYFLLGIDKNQKMSIINL